MSSKCIKCNKHLTNLEDVLQCSLCKIETHFHCNGISETAFRKMTNNTKKRLTCTNCNTVKSPTTSTEPSNLLEDKIEDLINSVSFMSQQFDEFNKKIESIFNEIKLVKIENEQIKKENTILSKEISEIRQKIDILEQQNLEASIEIIGIPKTVNENYIQ